jgi:hypothetical protein
MTVDINIDDILMDPSLDKDIKEIDEEKEEEEEIIIHTPPPTTAPPPQPVKAKEPIIKEPTKTMDQIIKEPVVDYRQEMTRMVLDRNSKTIEHPLIINDPSELLDGTIDPNEIIQQLITDPTKNDALCASINRDDTVNSIFNQIMKEIADELAYLKAYRKIHYLGKDDISEVSVKRVKCLKSLVDTLIEKEKLKNSAFEGKIDFGSEKFESIMEFILEKVKETFEKIGIPEQFNDIFFVQLAQNLEGYEKKLEKIYYGPIKK